jgi:hypothetical protein
LKCNVSVSAGVHIDNASHDELNVLMENCKEACKKLVTDFRLEKQIVLVCLKES